jgi:hypothetical protein
VFAVLLAAWVVLLTASLIELLLWPSVWLTITGNQASMVPPTEILFNPSLEPFFLERGYYWSYGAQIIVVSSMYLAVLLLFAWAIVGILALASTRLRPLNILLRTGAASGTLTLLLIFFASILYLESLVYAASALNYPGALALAAIALVFLAIAGAFLLVAVWFGNLLRDVVHYLGTGTGGHPLSDREATRRALATAIKDLRDLATVARVVIVCHSLGSVVVADWLLNVTPAGEPGRTVPIDLVTAGSPIRRLIVRLLPHRLPKPRELRRQLATGPLPVVRWFNVYRPLDFVGTRLLSGDACRDAERGILECPLVPRWHWPWGHSNYWADPRFTRLVAERVVAPIL